MSAWVNFILSRTYISKSIVILKCEKTTIESIAYIVGAIESYCSLRSNTLIDELEFGLTLQFAIAFNI